MKVSGLGFPAQYPPSLRKPNSPYLCAMKTTCEVRLAPADIDKPEQLQKAFANKLSVQPGKIKGYEIIRRSIDARGKPVYQLRADVWIDEPPQYREVLPPEVKPVGDQREVHIVGLGPAGIFAALKLIELGLKPVIFERGKPVRERRRDLANLTREGVVNPDSNYCFGEGGAGTFSDGKLYTRSDKRGDVQSVLNSFVAFGATHDILVDAHPHIGTNKLPAIIQAMREYILACGGEILFDTRLEAVAHSLGKIKQISLSGNQHLQPEALILATGHSARDVFTLLHQAGIDIEAKPFALGVRVEHPQDIVDQVQYHCAGSRPEGLPAAAYSLVRQVENRGVYSFCMCPGGIICPAATSEGEVVVNGWSPSMRNTGFANSGMVVEIRPEDWAHLGDSPLAAMEYQGAIEQAAFLAGTGKQKAPALRLTDYVNNRLSASLPDCSYLPGLVAADLGSVLPAVVHRRLQEGFRAFGKNMKGFMTEAAVVVAPESRTSSPVRIPRDTETLQHPQVSGLYPCGEGAGYAGGIMSAALDGMRVAEAVARQWVTA